MNIIVTGGSGAVGRYIVDELLAHRHTVGVLDLAMPHRAEPHFHRCDVLSLPEVTAALAGYDAVIHSAGIPHPLNDPPEKVYTVNTLGTFNVLEAAHRNGITKAVFTSSESVLGFAFAAHPLTPLALPVDESHPLRPQDPYGLSKVNAEQICRTYTERHGIRTVCLREPWIWLPQPELYPFYRSLAEEYPKWYKNLWAYVHVYDAARAHRLAVEIDLPEPHEAFFITAEENWTGLPSRELLQRFYPQAGSIAPEFGGAQSLISHAKASRLLGYGPRFSAKDLR